MEPVDKVLSILAEDVETNISMTNIEAASNMYQHISDIASGEATESSNHPAANVYQKAQTYQYINNVPVPSMDSYVKPSPECITKIQELQVARQAAKDKAKSEEGKHLPTDAATRKKIPLYSGVLKYFPDALVAVAKVSQAGNDQHNPGQPLHWARDKSTDQEDTLMRHLLEVGTVDVDGHRHAAKLAWRALAILQLEIEKEKNAVTKG
jgi:hypothetical protein